MVVCLKPVGKYVHKTTFMHFYRMLFVKYLERLKIQAIYFETGALYFQICALYFSRSALCFFACVHMQFYATGNKHVFVRSWGEKKRSSGALLPVVRQKSMVHYLRSIVNFINFAFLINGLWHQKRKHPRRLPLILRQ